MAYHDEVQMYGFSEQCVYNDHSLCLSPGCRCSCHDQSRKAAERTQVTVQPAAARSAAAAVLEKSCPQCKRQYSEDKNYCVADGHRLSSLRCAECGQVADADDRYCGYCGRGMKGEGRVDATVEELEEAALGPSADDSNSNDSAGDNREPASMDADDVSRPADKVAMPMPIITVGMFK